MPSGFNPHMKMSVDNKRIEAFSRQRLAKFNQQQAFRRLRDLYTWIERPHGGDLFENLE